MENPQRESPNDKSEHEGLPTVAPDVTSLLSTIEKQLREHDEQIDSCRSMLLRSVETSFRRERCERMCLWNAHNAMLQVRRAETLQALVRRRLAAAEERVAWLDRRRPNEKRDTERRYLALKIAEGTQNLKELSEMLHNKRNNIVENLAELVSITEAVNTERATLFMFSRALKQGRQKLIDTRNALLKMKNKT